MDPITLLAAATAAYNGVKKAVELGREVQDVYSQLSTWAGHAGNLKDAIENIEEKQSRPDIWKKITFEKSETQEAFDIYAAKKKLEEMEKQIMHMFLYGDLCHLGLDGYREFKKMRSDVHEKRKKMVEYQQMEREKFIDNIKIMTVAGLSILFGLLLLWWMTDFIFRYIK